MDIKSFFKKFIICLAPMASAGDFAFRKVCADCGADMVTTEMISAKALSKNSKKTFELLHEKPHAAVKCVQLFAHEEDVVKNVLSACALKDFDIIDFNCGCPAPKIVKNKEGSAMMADLQNAKKVITALVQNSNKPVSVKFRLGINGVKNYLEFGKMCEECGVSFLILHARMREQMYAGTSDIDACVRLKNAVKIPVIVSGDIIDEKSMQKVYNLGLNGVMIGRAALGNPLIFRALKEYAMQNGLNVYPLKNCKKMSKKQAILQHFNDYFDHFCNEKKSVAYFRKHLAWYLTNMPNAVENRKLVFTLTTKKEVLDFINKNF